MAILSAVLGIAVYLLVGVVGPMPVVHGLLIAGGLGLLSIVSAVALGASTPRLTAGLFQGSILLTLSLFSAISAGLIWAAAEILSQEGPKPTPSVKAVSSAIGAVVVLIGDHFLKSKRLLPSHVAQSAILSRYKDNFPKLHGQDKPDYKNAYDALFQPALSDAKGAIHGWGFDSTHRRLSLIRRGLRRKKS